MDVEGKEDARLSRSDIHPVSYLYDVQRFFPGLLDGQSFLRVPVRVLVEDQRGESSSPRFILFTDAINLYLQDIRFDATAVSLVLPELKVVLIDDRDADFGGKCRYIFPDPYATIFINTSAPLFKDEEGRDALFDAWEYYMFDEMANFVHSYSFDNLRHKAITFSWFLFHEMRHLGRYFLLMKLRGLAIQSAIQRGTIPKVVSSSRSEIRKFWDIAIDIVVDELIPIRVLLDGTEEQGWGDVQLGELTEYEWACEKYAFEMTQYMIIGARHPVLCLWDKGNVNLAQTRDLPFDRGIMTWSEYKKYFHHDILGLRGIRW